MTNRERFQAILNHRKPDDRLSTIEWAGWWDKTVQPWFEQGLDKNIPWNKIGTELGLDYHCQFWFTHKANTCPGPSHHGAAIMNDESDYQNLLPHLYPKDALEAKYGNVMEQLKQLKPLHDKGDVIIWFSTEGYFWFPRTLFGIENHLFSFYDYPELYHKICNDLVEYQLEQIEKIFSVLTPDFMTFAEDMSYNNGPMLSKECFDEFLAPYYKRVIPLIKQHGTKVFVDTDGDVTKMIPWLKSVGVEGILPLERQAGVDVSQIRMNHPEFLMLGAYDKTVMHKGEAAMRTEFERLLPAMKSGGFIPSVDHQTPPDVSFENYKVYVKLLKEYAEKAVR